MFTSEPTASALKGGGEGGGQTSGELFYVFNLIALCRENTYFGESVSTFLQLQEALRLITVNMSTYKRSDCDRQQATQQDNYHLTDERFVV